MERYAGGRREALAWLPARLRSGANGAGAGAAARAAMERTVGVVLPVLVMAMFLVLLVFSLLRLHDTGTNLRLEAARNMLWVTAQAEIAGLHLSDAVGRHALGDDDAAAVQRRRNVLASRLQLMQQGPQRRELEALGFADDLDRLRAALDVVDARLAVLEPADAAAARAAQQAVAPFVATFGAAANKAMTAQWEDLSLRLEGARQQLWQIVVSLLGILFAGVALFAHLLLAARSAHRRARALHKEQAFTELLIQSTSEAVIAVDAAARCTIWNATAARIFGREAAAAYGRRLSEISAFFTAGAVEQALRGALRGAVQVAPELPYAAVAADAPRYLETRAYPLREEGAVVGCVLLLIDVTECQRALHELARHRDRLGELVRARTQELHAALARERDAAQLYRSFGAMISHQFRTPLAIVDSALQRLTRRARQAAVDPAEIEVRAGRARQAIARLTRLIESTLDAARLDAGRIECRREPCDLHVVLQRICAQHDGETRERLRVAAPAQPLPLALCDPDHVEHAVGNLVANAVKYADPGTSIDLAVTARATGVACTVRNRGRFADGDDPEKLFGRYQRGANAVSLPGIGIGLYMARSLARLQGGDVGVHAADGTVTFTLTLPRAGAQHATPDSRALEPA